MDEADVEAGGVGFVVGGMATGGRGVDAGEDVGKGFAEFPGGIGRELGILQLVNAGGEEGPEAVVGEDVLPVVGGFGPELAEGVGIAVDVALPFEGEEVLINREVVPRDGVSLAGGHAPEGGRAVGIAFREELEGLVGGGFGVGERPEPEKLVEQAAHRLLQAADGGAESFAVGGGLRGERPVAGAGAEFEVYTEFVKAARDPAGLGGRVQTKLAETVPAVEGRLRAGGEQSCKFFGQGDSVK